MFKIIVKSHITYLSAIFTRLVAGSLGAPFSYKIFNANLNGLYNVKVMKIPLKQYWNLLVEYLMPQQGRVAKLAIALLTSIGLQILNPQILRYFIDTAIAGGSEQNLVRAALLFIGVALVTQVLEVAATYLGENVAWTATNALRVDLVEHCLNLDLSFHKSRTPGELIERVDGDVNRKRMGAPKYLLLSAARSSTWTAGTHR